MGLVQPPAVTELRHGSVPCPSMARLDQRHPANVDGAWFVDTRCIDCGTCRELAPDLFAVHADQSVVASQPGSPAGERRAWLAADACPTASIGRTPRTPKPARLFPLLVDGPVFDLGHTAESSFGATSYLVERETGNLLIDAPRFVRPLADRIEARGGIASVLLTHRDDVADADRWAARFGARVWIHRDDAGAAPFADHLIEGTEPVEVEPGVVAVPVPGHTRGSVIYVVDRTWAFTGDSLAWSHDRGDLIAFRSACWFSWPEQLRSLARLAEVVDFAWVLPGHGARVGLDRADANRRLRALVTREAS